VAIILPGTRSDEDLAERVTRRFFSLCENPRSRRAVLRFVRMSLSGGRSSRIFYSWLNRMVFRPLAGPAGMHVPAVRVQLVGSTLAGLAITRYVVRLEPIASMSLDELVPVVGPPLRGAVIAAPRGAIPAWDVAQAAYPRREWHELDARRHHKLTGRPAH